jgi:heme-degrading monooxygenase HmoA
MFARVSTYRATDPNEGFDADNILQGFQTVAEPLEQMDGFSHAYFLVDRASGNAISMTVWESEEALSASTAKADELRKRGSAAGGGLVESVADYEIGLTVGSPTTAGGRAAGRRPPRLGS